MKVLYVGADSLVSGAGFSMIKLIEELDQFEDIEIVPVVHKGNTERILTEKKRDHYVVNSWSLVLSDKYSAAKRFVIGCAKYFLNIPCYFHYRNIIKRENPDIIHINALTVSTVATAALHMNKPIVWHIREILEEGLHSSFWNPKSAYKLLRRADVFIPVSKCVEDKYAPILGKDKLKCVYNGIDDKSFYKPNHDCFCDRMIRITMAGRISEDKGQYKCLYALLNLLKSNTNIILQFAGTGSEREINRIRELAKEVEQQVKFLGYVDKMPELWESTDVAVVYSAFEAFGRVTVEAMMAGALVVGYKSGGTVELIEDGINGFFFDENRTLNDVFKDILANLDGARRIAVNGRERAANTFTSYQNAIGVKKVYEEILKWKK